MKELFRRFKPFAAIVIAIIVLETFSKYPFCLETVSSTHMFPVVLIKVSFGSNCQDTAVMHVGSLGIL